MPSLPANAREMIECASRHHRSGDVEKAEALYLKFLKLCPESPEALHMLGLLYIQTEKNDEAVSLIREAIKYRRKAAYLSHLGIALQNIGRNEEAVAACQEAIALNADDFSTHNTLGNAFRELGLIDEAIESFKKALRLRTDVAEIYFNLAKVLKDNGGLDEAVSLFLKAIELKPRYSEAYNLLGNVLNRQEKYEAAEACYRNALEIMPDYLEALYNLGNVLRQLKRFDEAVICYKKALSLKQDFPDALYNLANTLNSIEKNEESIEYYRKALELRPEFAEAYNGMGNALREMCRREESSACYKKAIELKPEFAEVYYNVSNILLDEGDAEGSIEYCRRALAMSPALAEAHWNMALAMLTKGDYEEGWRKYEWRFLKKGASLPPFEYREWEGQSLEGRTVLAFAEQGVGDEIMFGSCFSELISRAGRCIIECDKRLLPLFSRSFPGADFIERINSRTADGREENQEDMGADFQIAIGSLPRFFRQEISRFPGRKAYLRPDPEKLHKWQRRYSSLGNGLKIGISWRGGREVYVRNIRSTKLGQWADLFSLEGAHFINLQYGDCSAELKEIKDKCGITIHDWEDADPLKDLDGFAAQIAGLDLVISIDNSAVHMAGALGVPVWTLLPYGCDWRWMREFEDTPWYPSMRLFRQSREGTWPEVFTRILAGLREALLHGRISQGPLSGGKSYTSLIGGACPSRLGRRVALLNDTSNWYHWGCTGTSAAIYKSLSALGFEVEGIAIQGIHGLKNVPESIADFDSPGFFSVFSRGNRWIVRMLRDADIVVVNGEGSLHGISPFTLGLLYLAYASKIHLGKNVRIINHSCYPQLSPAAEGVASWEIYKKVYSEMDFVAIREPESLELILKSGIPVHQSFDCLPLYISENYSCGHEREGNRIVLAGPVAWKQAGIDKFSEYVRGMARFGFEVVVLTGAAAFPALDDEEFVKELHEKCPAGWKHSDAHSMEEWLDCIATAGLLVSGRFHHAIAAAVLGTPFILLESNTPKNSGIARVLETEEPIRLKDHAFVSKLKERTMDVLHQPAAPQRNDVLVDRLCAGARENFHGLKELAQLTIPKGDADENISEIA